MTKLRVLVVAQDPTTLQTIERAVATEGDELITAMDVAEAIATAASEVPDVAFVDVAIEARAGLALVHHLPAVCPNVALYAMAPAEDIDLGTEALALGAAGLLVTPPVGDAILRAVGEVRARRAEANERVRLQADLDAARKRAELLARVTSVLKLGRAAGRAEAANTIANALAEASGARGAAIYAVHGSASHEWVQLATIGTLAESGAAAGDDLHAGRQILSLTIGDRIVGHAVLDEPHEDTDILPIAEIAAAVLALFEDSASSLGDGSSDAKHVYPFAYFDDTARREIDKAKRHGRRLAVAVVLPAPGRTASTAELEALILDAVRETDTLAHRGDGEFVLLLPETGAIGAHTCRRRVLARTEGRAKPSKLERRAIESLEAHEPAASMPILVGVATYPHDGKVLARLLDIARRRAEDVARSPVRLLSLSSRSLPEIIDALLDCPMLDAGRGSPFPLELSIPATLSLISNVCKEALRGGGATILVASQPGMGIVSAVRPALGDESANVTLHEVDVTNAEGCDNAEAIVIVAEHGAWALCGRHEGARFKAVHCADPLVADLLAQRLAQAAGVHLG